MRRSTRERKVPERFLLPPDSSEGSDEDDDSDKGPDFDPQEVRAIKWMDNRGVVVVTTFESAFPLTNMTRFEKKEKKVISVPCPRAITTYNKFMGGVDLLDGLVAYFRIDLRSRKYYMRIFNHFLS
ncbi:piggyBac transposable element-derived protein 3-like [Macrosteles quadrilineatus]|uniref:piggyBac transposable element-derived protein 3-like n=1 Tax=Macrosteles quadrilineatus TaxID=74068 RepID=UPI0023E268B4|nr:piggyBac transposable element-derived protein 3-like [Macrosteles quadrilineatus]